MKRRELLRQTAAFGLVATAPFRLAQGEGSNKVIPALNPLKPPAEGSIPVAFLISEGAVVIDFCGPWEVFQDVSIPGRRDDPFRLFTVAETTNPIHASGGL